MSTKQVYIIHGYMATPDSHWFQWLKHRLSQHAIEVTVLAMPDSHAPNVDAWQQTLQDEINQLDENSYFIAHSLGCVSLLQFLTKQPCSQKLGGMILISGFKDVLPLIPELTPFVETPINFHNIIKQLPHRALFASPQDSIVPFSYTDSLATQLHAEFYSIEHAGHFLASDGYDEFPIVYDRLMLMMSSNHSH
jgi:predicted alpha/beta hydrolase family esterase